MDGHTKMPLKQGHSDEEMMYFQDLYASPAKSDASSVDIYDGLDITALAEQAVEKCSPSRNCLDLYEEILTEEGTAKETSFNDLSADYEKCQRQMKQLITRLKEMKSMNSSLQNENQCLKKNISALIKTARVEITRKEDEINRLNQRLGMPEKNHSFRPNPVPLMNINISQSDNDDLSKNIRNTENLAKEAVSLQSKELTSRYSKNLCDKEKTCVESSQTCPSISKPIAKQCIESTVTSSHVKSPCLEANDTNKKEISLENRNKVTERNRTKERPKSSSANLASESSDLKEKVRKSPQKCGRNEFSQEKRNSKSETSCETEDRKYHSSSSKEKMQLKDLDPPKEKDVRKYERSPHRRESRAYEKERNTESRHKTAEKIEEPRRSKRTHFSTPKDDGSHKILEQSDGKTSSNAVRKDKRSSEYNESKHGNKDSKPSKSENSQRNKPDRDNKAERSDRERRGDEKKRSRDDHNRSRHDRKAKGQEMKVIDTHQSSSKGKGSHSKVSEKNEKVKVDSGQKDLKLSFMETLNLTLSPAKKTPDHTLQVVSIASSKDCEVEEGLAKDSAPPSVIENSADFLSSQQTNLTHSELVSMEDISTKVLNIEDSKQVSPSEPSVDMKGQPNSAVDENKLLEKLTVDEKQPVSTAVHTVDLEVIDRHSSFDGSDLIDLDSFIEIDRCSGSPCSETPSVSTPAEQTQDNSIVEPSEEEDKAMILKSNQTETPKGICESPDTDLVNVSTKGIENKQCVHDEGSIDFNFLRHIPKLLSPLKSPARPKALHTFERTAKASIVSNLHKELLPEANVKSTCLSASDEINKENCQPDNKLDFGCIIEVSSNDELEEGEILSDEEQISNQTVQPINNPGQLVPDPMTSVTKSQSGQDSEPLSKTEKLIMLPEKSATKKKTKIDSQPKLAALPTSKQRKLNADSCLDGILKIVTPSSIQDVLQMLRIIRKHIRKKYMKFKVQFPLTQFHCVIEKATLYFLTLVRSLDWSSICSSPETLQKKLCRQIETRLKMLKKNGIVDRIFEQHLLDMKKRLWKFVEEQLDSLFDILKVVIVKLCDKAEVEKDTESCTNTQKSSPVKNSKKEKKKHVDKHTLPKSGSVTCLRKLEFHKVEISRSKNQNDTEMAVQEELVKELKPISVNSNNVDIPSNKVSPASKLHLRSPSKISTSNEPKSQQNTSGLSFNLVNDDHMGDIFKSLLHDSNNLPCNTLPKSTLIFGTPEKSVSSSQKFDNLDSLPEHQTPPKTAFSWSLISSPRVPTFPGLEAILNPDVFDENCLLETPTSASTSKSLNGSDDRLKSYSSILLEDLAVSLTVPSPLKSDSHLSFLRPTCITETISEVDGKCCEGSVLEEDDVIDQDIHLTLDSDNSSIGSLEDSGEIGSFQYHPSEPMQAVIMEKSNDHFIVKIRRAVSSSPPVSDCSPERINTAAPRSVKSMEDNTLEMEPRLDTKSEEPNDSQMLHADHVDVAVVTEHCTVDVERLESVPFTEPENESIFKLPPSRSKPVEIPAEVKQTADDTVEPSGTDAEKNATSCIKEICCPAPPADVLPMKTFDANTVDLNLKKKKRKSLDGEQSAKRQKKFSPPDRDKDTRHNIIEDLQKSNKGKHNRAVSDGAINVQSSQVSPTNLSAKNVIKKKGEVVVSWTRDEDRAILLECQKLGPTKKTFVFLSSTMDKYPHQVEERFRQLMKLFKKSRNSSS